MRKNHISSNLFPFYFPGFVLLGKIKRALAYVENICPKWQTKKGEENTARRKKPTTENKIRPGQSCGWLQMETQEISQVKKKKVCKNIQLGKKYKKKSRSPD